MVDLSRAFAELRGCRLSGIDLGDSQESCPIGFRWAESKAVCFLSLRLTRLTSKMANSALISTVGGLLEIRLSSEK